MWGGRFNPMIPVGNPELGKQLVNVFRVDVLIPLSDGKDVKAFIDQFPYLPSPFLDPQLFVDRGSGRISAKVLDLYHSIRRLYEEHFKNNPQPTFLTSLYEWSDDDPLADVFLATFGGFPPREDTGMDYRGLIEEYLAAEKIALTGGGVLPPDSFKKATPNWICSLYLERYYSVINSWGTPGVYVGSAADFHDLVNYWNLRATGTDLLFYDLAFSDRLDALRAEFLTALRARPKSPHEFDAQVAIWSQEDRSDAGLRVDDQLDLTGFGRDVLRCHLSFATWNGLNVKAPLMHFGEKSVLAAVGNSFGSIRVSFSLPEKPCFDEPHVGHQHLIASIHPLTGLYDNERATLMTQFLPELNEYYGRNYYFWWNKCRVEPEGIGIIIDSRQTDLDVSALDVTSLIAKIFEVAEMRTRPSQAGLIASRLIQQLGGPLGLVRCGVFKSAGARELIKKYKPDQSFTKSAAIQIIRENDSRNSHSWARESRPEDMFANLVTHGVFRVGLKLECPNCHLDFWVSLDDVRTQTICEYCGQDFNVTPQLRDRDWRYRRSGLFGRDNHQEGGITVALTLLQIQTSLHLHNILCTTALEIEPAGAPVQKCETDFVILTQEHFNHEVQIAIGECKNRGEITEDDVAKLRMVAEAVEKKHIQVYVIFAKLSDFTPEAAFPHLPLLM
jgi:hypothetical protein